MSICEVTAQLIRAFAFAYAKSRFLRDAAQMLLTVDEHRSNKIRSSFYFLFAFKGRIFSLIVLGVSSLSLLIFYFLIEIIDNLQSKTLFLIAYHLCSSMQHIYCHGSVESHNPWPRGYKTFFMLNSAELEIYPDHKC